MSDTSKKQAVREYMLVAYVWEKKSYQEMYQIVINSLLIRAGLAPLYQLSNDLNISLLFGYRIRNADRNDLGTLSQYARYNH